MPPSPSSLSHALRCQVQCGDIVTATGGIVAVEGPSGKNYTSSCAIALLHSRLRHGADSSAWRGRAERLCAELSALRAVYFCGSV